MNGKLRCNYIQLHTSHFLLWFWRGRKICITKTCLYLKQKQKTDIQIRAEFL